MSEDRETHATGEGRHTGWSRRDFLRRTGQATLATAMGGGVADFLASGASAALKPLKGGTYLDSGGTSAGFNPIIDANQTDRMVHSQIFDGLITWDAHGNLIPRIAAAMPTVSRDQLTYTFKLRPNVKWTDGTPLTGEDVVFTYSLMANPKYAAVQSSYRGDLSHYLASIHAPDAHTVVFKLKQPYAPFLAGHGFHGIVPVHVLGKLSPAEINAAPFNSAPTVSNGPFKFVEWVKNDHVTLVPNKAYYGQVPYLNEYVFRTFPAEADLVNALKTGEMSGGRITAASDFLELHSSSGLTSYVYPDNGLTDYFYQLDTTKSAAAAIFADRNVRQALVWGLDRAGMAKGIYLGFGGVVPDSIFASVSWAYSAKTEPKYTYNPTKAAQILAAAGWTKNSNGILEKNGKTLKFTITAPVNAIQYTQCAQAMQSNWKALGCDVSLNLIQYAQLLSIAYFTRQFDVIIPGYGFNPDPDPSATFHSRNIIPGGLNAASYSNPTVDRLLDEAVATTDQTKRTTIYHQIANLIATDVPMVPMVRTTGMYTYNDHFHGLGPNNIGTFTNVVNRPFADKIWYQS